MATDTLTIRTRADARLRATRHPASTAAICAITGVGALLRFASFGLVPANPFYDAAARSMGQSWHNFFYGAFEPGGQVSIDKTPVDLWLQVASTKLFGFSSVSTRLPEAVAGVLAVPLLYDLVRRLFGRRAGLGAAAALAMLPISIVTAHSDTMDSLMMALDVLAAWLVVVGAQRRQAWPVVAAGAVMGLAFNVKLFEALLVLPALGVLAWLASDDSTRRRAATIAGALATLVGVGLSWVTAASIAPLSARPWPIGSTNGSAWNVVFAFNGLDRLRTGASPAALRLDPPGPLRFLGGGGHDYPSLVGTVLVAAVVFGGLALGAAVLARGSRKRRRLPFAGAAFLTVWLVTGVGLLSEMQRLQPRYLESVTPAIASALGVGVAWLAAHASTHRLIAAATAGGAILVAVSEAIVAHPPAWSVAVSFAAAASCAPLALTVARRPAAARALTACALMAALAVPAASALTVARDHMSDAGLVIKLPTGRLSAFLIHHQGAARYEVASATVFRAAPLIVHDGRPVLMLTSLDGRPLLSAARLAHLVAAGDVRYALLGARGCTDPCPAVVRWAHAHAHDVSRTAQIGRPGTLSRLTVR